MGACVLGFAAGALSALSPCVLPLLPLVLAGAVERHRLGPLVLAAGLATAATVVGFAVALLGFALDRDLVRVIAGGLLVLVGLVLLIARLGPGGLAGQFVVGALLGALWTPCGGPTLGAAIGLATQRRSLGAAAAVMAAYSLGAVAPVLLLAYGSRRLAARPDRLALVTRLGKPAIGVALVVLGMLSVTGGDKVLEARVLDAMPAWLVDLTTRF